MLVTIDIDKLQEEHVHLGIIRNNIVFNQAKFSRL